MKRVKGSIAWKKFGGSFWINRLGKNKRDSGWMIGEGFDILLAQLQVDPTFPLFDS